eukprot:2451752-Pleurochrysis_carterae.AAC.3
MSAKTPQRMRNSAENRINQSRATPPAEPKQPDRQVKTQTGKTRHAPASSSARRASSNLPFSRPRQRCTQAGVVEHLVSYVPMH